MWNVQFSMGDSLINWEMVLRNMNIAMRGLVKHEIHVSVCVYLSFFKVALSISPWMVSTRVPKEGPPQGVIWFSKKIQGDLICSLVPLFFGAGWFILGQTMHLGSTAPWFRICLNHQFLGLGGHLEFQVIKEELSRRYTAIYSSSIGYDSPWLHRHLVLKHDDRWNHSISAKKTAFQHIVMHSAKSKFSRFPTHSVWELHGISTLGHIIYPLLLKP